MFKIDEERTKKMSLKIAKLKQSSGCDIKFLDRESCEKVRRFHKSFPQYKETPLANLHELAKLIGVKDIFVKDESYRFGLNAFKVLGGSYAIGNYIANRLKLDIDDLGYEKIVSDEIRNKLGDITFITATDGNHGRGVAWTAKQLGQKSIVLMPKGSSEERLKNIRAEGAQASITEYNYDDTVRMANKLAEENGYVMVQDTAWEGYTDIPRWIIEGYSTMAGEAFEQIPVHPTHIFVQAGVGSLASAVTGFFTNAYKANPPMIIITEPDAANCIYRSAKAADGKPHFVGGEMNTIMAGLACGEPCTIGWEVLKSYADYSLSCPDFISANGMRILGNPAGNDPRVVSGESGAVSVGAVTEIMTQKECGQIKEMLGLDENSVILCFSTEGATDIQNYRKIVWNGAYAKEDL